MVPSWHLQVNQVKWGGLFRRLRVHRMCKRSGSRQRDKISFITDIAPWNLAKEIWTFNSTVVKRTTHFAKVQHNTFFNCYPGLSHVLCERVFKPEQIAKPEPEKCDRKSCICFYLCKRTVPSDSIVHCTLIAFRFPKRYHSWCQANILKFRWIKGSLFRGLRGSRICKVPRGFIWAPL